MKPCKYRTSNLEIGSLNFLQKVETCVDRFSIILISLIGQFWSVRINHSRMGFFIIVIFIHRYLDSHSIQLFCIPSCLFIHSNTLKHRGQTWPGKGPLGSYSIPGQPWPGDWSTCLGIWPRAGPIRPHYLSSLQKADHILGHFWPRIEYDPNGPFSGSLSPGCFESEHSDLFSVLIFVIEPPQCIKKKKKKKRL